MLGTAAVRAAANVALQAATDATAPLHPAAPPQHVAHALGAPVLEAGAVQHGAPGCASAVQMLTRLRNAAFTQQVVTSCAVRSTWAAALMAQMKAFQRQTNKKRCRVVQRTRSPFATAPPPDAAAQAERISLPVSATQEQQAGASWQGASAPLPRIPLKDRSRKSTRVGQHGALRARKRCIASGASHRRYRSSTRRACRLGRAAQGAGARAAEARRRAAPHSGQHRRGQPDAELRAGAADGGADELCGRGRVQV